MHQLCCHKGRKGIVVLLFNIKVWVHHRLFSHFKSRHGILKFGEICESMWGVQVSWRWEAETGVFFTVSALFLWFCQVRGTCTINSLVLMHTSLISAIIVHVREVNKLNVYYEMQCCEQTFLGTDTQWQIRAGCAASGSFNITNTFHPRPRKKQHIIATCSMCLWQLFIKLLSLSMLLLCWNK